MKFSKNEISAFIKGYYVDNNGNVYGPKGHMLKKLINNSGYYFFTIKLNYKVIPITFHRYVAFLKYGNRIYSKGIEVRHLNSIKLDNCFNNIAIGTHSENMMDKPKEVRMKSAITATSHMTKYSKELVKEIREYHQIDKSYKKTMFKFSISNKATLHYILNYRII